MHQETSKAAYQPWRKIAGRQLQGWFLPHTRNAGTPTIMGLFIMDEPGYDPESVTGIVAAGAQIVIFTTGRGTPLGSPVAPVIKVTGNARTYKNHERQHRHKR